VCRNSVAIGHRDPSAPLWPIAAAGESRFARLAKASRLHYGLVSFQAIGILTLVHAVDHSKSRVLENPFVTFETDSLVGLTADIVAAQVANNTVAVSDVPALIQNVHAALAALGNAAPVAVEGPKPAVSIRASIKPDYLVSMIDGKRYKMLKRHLGQNGYTPESYRAAYGLPADYPMTAATYAAMRSELAKKIGLGRKPKAAPVPAAKASRKPRAVAAAIVDA
jgi:predicted transcriptional regulator